MQDRFDTWSEVWDVIKEYPMGIGMGMTGAASLKYPDSTGLSRVTLDNSYLEILMTTGWPGLILFLILATVIMIRLIILPEHLYKDLQLLRIALSSTFVSYLAIMFFGEYIELNPARTIAWIMVGIAVSLPRIQRISDIK
jgi:O-antigen ligase